jgi:AcrR family transcriptional regulator
MGRHALQPDEISEFRSRLCDAALRLFADHGYDGFTLRALGLALECSPTTPYRYFRNKQAIGLAVVEKFFEMSETAMETGLILPTGTPESRIRMLIETGVGHLVNEMQKNPKIVELADFLCSDEEGIALLKRHIAWKRDRMVRELGRGIEQCMFRDADPQETAATVLLATKVFWTPPALAQWRDKNTILPELREVLDMIFDGINRK